MALSTLEGIVDEVLAGLDEHFGYDSLWITAGSAVGILDSCLHGEPLHMRDFDLVLLADRTVTREWAAAVGERLDSPHLQYLPRHLWTRSRFHPERTHEAWNAGWGFLFDAGGLEVDLSIYHDAAAHETNGLLDIHRVRIPVSRQRPLRQIVQTLHCSTWAEAVACGLVEDPWDGYRAWRRGSARVVCWPPIQLEPIQSAIRVVRDCVQKLGQTELETHLAARLARAIRQGTDIETAHLDIRNLLKVLTDVAAARELVMLEQLGVFEDWLPGLGRRIDALGFDDLEIVLAGREPSVPWALTRLVALLRPLAGMDRDAMVEIVEAVRLMEKELAAELWRRLEDRPAPPAGRSAAAAANPGFRD